MEFSARQSSVIALLVAGALFMEQLDGTVIATALPQMAKTFAVGPVDLNIGISAYLLTVAVFIPASGWVTDRYGARVVFGSAIATFTIASILCAASGSLFAFTAARIVQGIGGAMMVPVGRLIVLRNTEKQDLIRAIAFLTWPALTAPVIGPPLGGLITTYSSWPWIFLLNVPLGIIGLALALILIPNSRVAATGPFDWSGFLITGLASFGLMYSLESIARSRIDWRIATLLLAASVGTGFYGIRHARRAAHPLLDLTAFALPTFAITVRGGVLIRTAISAAPFLLPLMFQLAFGLDPLASGLLLLAVFAGNLGMKPATSAVLKTFGFRRTVLVNGSLAMATIMACGLMTPQTPKALIVAVLFVSGLSRSMQFTTINALSFSELSQERMSGANTLFSMMQQAGNALGVAIGAVALHVAGLAHPDSATVTIGDFHIAFVAVGLIGLAGVFEFRRLPPHAGEVLR
ncbi:MAG TPA: MFS transporter [Xanthobacteraceae bacterium]|jgi:EmrB/QacA subfamily drug resistance transporter|nr:MFS transporter [Xanthobacteraceae bacterium]